MDRIIKALLTSVSALITWFFVSNFLLEKSIVYLATNPTTKFWLVGVVFVIICNLVQVVFSQNISSKDFVKYFSFQALVLVFFFILQFLSLENLVFQTIDLKWLLTSWQIQIVLSSVFIGSFIAIHLKSSKEAKYNVLIPWIIFILSSILYILMSLGNHNSFGTPARDLGIFDQAIWNLSNFDAPASTIRGFSNLWGDHWHPVLALFSPLYWIFDDVRAILIAQALIISSAVFAVYSLSFRFTKNNLISIAFALAYILYGGIQHAVNFGFYPENIAPALMLLSFSALFDKKYLKYFIFFFLALLTKENIALYFAFFALILFFKTEHKKIAIYTFISSVLYFLLSFKFILPYFSGSDSYQYANLYSKFGETPGQVIKNIIMKPGLTLETLFNPVLKFDTLMTIFGSVLFLPFLSVWGLAIIPNLFENFLSGRFVQWPFGYHYQAGVVAMLIFASIMAISAFGKRFTKEGSKQLFSSIGLALIIAIVFINVVYSLPLYSLFPIQIRRLVQDRGIKSSLELIPRNAMVSAQNTLAPHLSHRKTIYHYPEINGSEYIVLSETLSSFPLEKQEISAKILEYKEGIDWQLVSETPDVVIFRKK